MESDWKDRDTNGDDALDATEFEAALKQWAIHGLTDIPLAEWDSDRNGRIELAESRQGILAAYGLVTSDGFDLRPTPGIVYSLAGWKHLDKDGNESLSVDEIRERMQLSPEAASQRLTALDTDGSGDVSREETRPFLNVDVLGRFLVVDKDLDGKIGREEFLAGSSEWERVIANPTFLGGDVDDDGFLSFSEFRRLPQSNPVVAWHERRWDQDRDGALGSINEFLGVASPSFPVLSREVFARLDGNADGRLTLDEFPFGTARLDASAEFRRRDVDGSGKISEDELPYAVPPNLLPKARRALLVFDLDDDGSLTRDEFGADPEVTDPAERSVLPDPFAEAVARDKQPILAAFDAAGVDPISESLFSPAVAMVASGHLQRLPAGMWDINSDTKWNKDEVLNVVESAWGGMRLEGTVVRYPTGLVVNAMLFDHADADQNGRVSKAEYLERGFGGADAAEKFARIDRDKDGEMLFAEWAADRISWVDPVAEFLQIDIDLDGVLSSEELTTHVAPWLKDVALGCRSAYDDDADGKLTLTEYRRTPLANRLTTWQYARWDRDGDVKLSPDEFCPVSGPVWLRAYSHDYHRRLDRNNDGFLDRREFQFEIDLSRVSPELAFDARDTTGDGALSLEEFQAGLADSRKLIAKRDFLSFDVEADGALSRDEYRSIPTLFPPDKRGTLPDPFQSHIDETWQVVRRLLGTRGKSGLKNADFNVSKLTETRTGLERFPFSVWDLDGDGLLLESEARRIVEAAWGQARIDGTPGRLPSGIVVNAMLFDHADRDHDSAISKPEYLEHGFGGEQAEARFKDGDADGDGRLTFAEWSTKPHWQFDPPADFLRMDADADGLLSAVELKQGRQSWMWVFGDKCTEVFDANHDGSLSLAEYRLTPLANFQTEWQTKPGDRDGDVKLSLAEFYPSDRVWLAAFTGEWFRRFDRNSDGFLDLDEYDFPVDPNTLPLELLFRVRDRNRDGDLERDEYQASFPTALQPAASRNFLLFDGDRDGRLSISEFAAIPGVAGLKDRTSPQDPVTQLSEDMTKSVLEKLLSADANADGVWNKDEFQRSGLARQIPGFELSPWTDWDLDGNGTFTKDEAGRVVEMAWGGSRSDGTPVRGPDGILANAMLFDHADEDHDQVVSRAEYMEHGFGGPQAAERFAQGDKDGNGQLTFAEWRTEPIWHVDPISDFLRMDTDFDSLVSAEELKVGTYDWLQAVQKWCLPAFDNDGDGRLSLAEYRLTPLANRLKSWQQLPWDRDGDATLTFAEFHDGTGPWLRSLARETFGRLDRNHDGRLSPDEYSFHLDPARVSPEIAFAYRDTDSDGTLTLTELLVDLHAHAKVSNDPGVQVAIGQVEEAFELADENIDGKLSRDEFQTDDGLATVRPGQNRKTSGASQRIARNPADTETNGRFAILLGVNVLLLAGVAWWLLFRKPD